MYTPEPHFPEAGRRLYCFGEFKLDLEGGALIRGAQEVALRRKSFEVLTYLVERHGRLVGKEELIAAIWPDSATTDNSLAQCRSWTRKRYRLSIEDQFSGVWLACSSQNPQKC